jgi:ligand-binding sensor domain-containing protein/signal transduction histidine kinase
MMVGLWAATLAPAWALDPARSIFQYNCQTWRRSNGLPASGVLAIAQDGDGKLWLGTSQGLVAFDGVGFRTFSAGRENAAVTALARRGDGGLWVGLERGGLLVWDGRTMTSARRPEWDGPFSTVRAMEVSRNGKLLVAGINIGGALGRDGDYQSFLPAPGTDVFSIHEDTTGRVWLGTSDRGLVFWRDGRIEELWGEGLRNQVISAVQVAPDGRIWVGGSNGLRCFDADFQEVGLGPSAEFTSQPRALLVDRHGVVWIGTVASGLVRYQNGVFTSLHKRDGLASDRILALAESQDGSLWVGTEDGVSQLSDVKFPMISATEGLAQEAAFSVTPAPDGSVWVATPNGISHIAGNTVTNLGRDAQDGFTSRWIKQVLVSRSGDLYVVGAAKNVDRLHDGKVVESWKLDSWATKILEDSRGVMVALGPTLIRLVNGGLETVTLADGSPLAVRWIHDAIVARDDSIWLAAVDGVQQLKDGVLRNLCHENGVYESSFYYLTEDDDGTIWGAQNTGIARFRQGKMKQISKAEGLHENRVYAIVPDNAGSYWMDSGRGIFRVGRHELNAVADGAAARVESTVFDGEDAVKTTDLAQPIYSGCRSRDGRIWFPSSQGVIIIDPAHVPVDRQPIVVFVERVLVDGQEYSAEERAGLKPTAGNLEFDYAALDYRAPQKVRYRYRLEGYETGWVEAGGRRSAFYTNVPHGRYRFQVQASNADGVWNTAGASVALELPPRFFETLWFRALVLAGLAGLIAYVAWMIHLRRRHARLRQTHELLEAKVRERTAELRAEIEERKKMQLEVERIHRELLDVSRQAGMAEIATGVLHNVGNVLTSLNVSATLLSDRIKESKVAWVAKIRDLVQAHAADLGNFFANDPRGQALPQFLDSLAKQLANEQADLTEEVQSLRKNVEHIRDIVTMQQNYATVSGVMETVPLVDVLEDAVRINADALARHAVELTRDYRTQPVLTMDKHKVLQILINLIRNAKYACEDTARSDRRIIVKVWTEDDRAKISVIDNGVGIPPENLKRIFTFGFTTRKKGHGFGLHNGALAARNFGGALSVRSDGVGQGAEFTLEIPLRAPGATEFAEDRAARGLARDRETASS